MENEKRTPGAFLCTVGKIGDKLETFYYAVGIVSVVAFFLAVVLDVAARTAKSPILWCQEVAVFCYFWGIFTAYAIYTRTNEHFSIEILTRFPEAAKRIKEAVVALLTAAFAYVLIRYGYDYAILGLVRHSVPSGIPLFYPLVVMPIGGAGAAFFLFERLLCIVSGVSLSDISKRHIARSEE
ncbi:MAG TPA: TRAP transporter small permease [Anaerovoracaceae bacterium]|nr:TRAP transporter small permease [Anaerovoracaceae bacterium]